MSSDPARPSRRGVLWLVPYLGLSATATAQQRRRRERQRQRYLKSHQDGGRARK